MTTQVRLFARRFGMLLGVGVLFAALPTHAQVRAPDEQPHDRSTVSACRVGIVIDDSDPVPRAARRITVQLPQPACTFSKSTRLSAIDMKLAFRQVAFARSILQATYLPTGMGELDRILVASFYETLALSY